MRTFTFIVAFCTAIYSVQAAQSQQHYFPADATTLGNECSWMKKCSLSVPSGCEQYPFHERPCSCLTPAAKCMYEYWKGFSTSQREAMYDRCGQTQFPFGVHMHYLQQKNCEFAEIAQKGLDTQREEESYSYSCGWDLTVGLQHGSVDTYTHNYHCLRAPGWPSPARGKSLNYTAFVMQNSGGEGMSMSLSVTDDAGINFKFYTADGKTSKSGTLEPGQSDAYCSNALSPNLRSGFTCTDAKYDQPHIGETGRKWVMYFENRNWIHKAHVNWKFGSHCFNGQDSTGDYSLCTGQAVNWGLLDGSLNTYYAINGCDICNGGDSSNPCCISTGNPPSQSTGCGLNCHNCENVCPSTHGYYQKGYDRQ